jgi:hypothetical protein
MGWEEAKLCHSGGEDIERKAELIQAAGAPLQHLSFEYINSDNKDRYLFRVSERSDAFAVIAPRLAPLATFGTLHI